MKDELLLNQLKQKEAQIERLQRALQNYSFSKNELQAVKSSYNTVVESRCWKMTAPLRRFLDRAKGNPTSAPLEADKCDKTLDPEEAFCRLVSATRIDILTPAGYDSLAAKMQSILKSLHLESQVVSGITVEYGDGPYIVICPDSFASLPPFYVALYPEESAGKARNKAVLSSAFAVLEASAGNLAQYERNAVLAKNVFYVPTQDSAEFEFFFLRFLLAYDMLSFDAFYEKANGFISFSGSRICLSMPETVERRQTFIKANQYGFELFPGLRHRTGWIGCAMSYKFMAKKALDSDRNQILICEDDVLFPSRFDEKFNIVLKYLESNNEWDAFSGIMADLTDTEVINSFIYNNTAFVELNRMVSMVFNFYSTQCLKYMALWDYQFEENQIDQFLHKKQMHIITTVPFLVGHQESLTSTVCDESNSRYSTMIQNSSDKLKELIRQKNGDISPPHL